MSEMLKNDLLKLGFKLVDKGDWFDLYIKIKNKSTLVGSLSLVDKEDYFKIVPTEKLHIIGAPPFRLLKIINTNIENLEMSELTDVLNKFFMVATLLVKHYNYNVVIMDPDKILSIFYC